MEKITGRIEEGEKDEQNTKRGNWGAIYGTDNGPRHVQQDGGEGDLQQTGQSPEPVTNVMEDGTYARNDESVDMGKGQAQQGFLTRQIFTGYGPGYSFLSTLNKRRLHNYIEDHKFEKFEMVYSFVVRSSNLEIMRCLVLDTFKNPGHVPLYQLRTSTPSLEDMISPAQFCFRFFEDALYYFWKVCNETERQEIRQCLNVILAKGPWFLETCPVSANERNSEHKYPRLRTRRTKLEGPIAVGYTTVILESTEEEEKTTRHAQVDTSPYQPYDPFSKPHKLPEKFKGLHESYNASDLKALDIENSGHPTKNRELLDRALSHACGGITLHVQSRIRDELGFSYQDLRHFISSDLHYFYLQSPPAERRFLMYEHYRLATEIEVPGTWNIYWCSLCKLEHSFGSEQDLKRHFYQYHSIVARKYVCISCKEEFILPSEFRSHVFACDERYASHFHSHIPVWFSDAYSDYVRYRRDNFDLLIPGLPNYRNMRKPGPSHRSGEQNRILGIDPSKDRPRKLKMDLKNNCPLDASVKMEPAWIGIQEKYHSLKSWDDPEKKKQLAAAEKKAKERAANDACSKKRAAKANKGKGTSVQIKKPGRPRKLENESEGKGMRKKRKCSDKASKESRKRKRAKRFDPYTSSESDD